MTKNYFTDSQVKEIAASVDGSGVNDGVAIFSAKELKALMNLAVETAIGGPVAWCVENKNGDGSNVLIYGNALSLKPGDNLYKIQELDN